MLHTDSQKVLLLYNPATYDGADVIGTYVYRQESRYEYMTAIGLMTSVVSFITLYLTNKFSKLISVTSLW